jgi:hypothetical protein
MSLGLFASTGDNFHLFVQQQGEHLCPTQVKTDPKFAGATFWKYGDRIRF